MYYKLPNKMKKIINNIKNTFKRNMQTLAMTQKMKVPDIFLNFSKKKETDRKFQIISDIYIDTRQRNFLGDFIKIPVNSEKINLIIAGNIGDPHKEKYWNFINDCCEKYNKVFFTTGNREYWKNNKTIEETNEYINLNIQFNNLYFLNDDSHYCEKENFTIVGSTLWTPTQNLDDIKNIKYFTNKLRNMKHKETIEYIESECNFNSFDDTVKLNNHIKIVMSHNSPIKVLPNLKYFNKLHSNDFDYKIFKKIHLWVSGGPDKINFKYGTCSFKSNPVGHLSDEYTGYNDEIICL